MLVLLPDYKMLFDFKYERFFEDKSIQRFKMLTMRLEPSLKNKKDLGKSKERWDGIR